MKILAADLGPAQTAANQRQIDAMVLLFRDVEIGIADAQESIHTLLNGMDIFQAEIYYNQRPNPAYPRDYDKIIDLPNIEQGLSPVVMAEFRCLLGEAGALIGRALLTVAQAHESARRAACEHGILAGKEAGGGK